MEYNVENYQKKSKKHRIKLYLVIIVVFIILLFGGLKIAKSNNSYTNNLEFNSKNNTNIILENKESTSSNIDNTAKDKEENMLEVEENDINNIEENEEHEEQEEWKSVDENYFSDAVFIGDSRTEGFILNNGLTAKVNSYTHKGLTVDTIFNDKIINMNGKKLTIMEALKETSFSKVYIMLGINETGWVYSDMFINKYEKVIDEIKKINSKCTIYIESIIPVTEQVSNEHQYINNVKINEYNSLIKEMAEEKGIYYLNVQEALINENGVLPDEAATDGIHLNRKYCEKWFEYLKNHTL